MKRKNAAITIRVSYLEVYNEEIKDLFHPNTPTKCEQISISISPNKGFMKP